MSVAESRRAAMPYARDSPQTRLVPQIGGFSGNACAHQRDLDGMGVAVQRRLPAILIGHDRRQQRQRMCGGVRTLPGRFEWPVVRDRSGPRTNERQRIVRDVAPASRAVFRGATGSFVAGPRGAADGV